MESKEEKKFFRGRNIFIATVTLLVLVGVINSNSRVENVSKKPKAETTTTNTETPKLSKEAIIAKIRGALEDSLGDNAKSIRVIEHEDYVEFRIIPFDGFCTTAIGSPEIYSGFANNVVDLSGKSRDVLLSNGHLESASFTIINDLNHEKVLLSAVDGKLVYDFLNNK